ncbi:MAG: hypothetical protein P8X42_17325 [Calditrichaceae bacterium]
MQGSSTILRVICKETAGAISTYWRTTHSWAVGIAVLDILDQSKAFIFNDRSLSKDIFFIEHDKLVVDKDKNC